MVEKFPAVLEILPQVLRGGIFLTHTVGHTVVRVALISVYRIRVANVLLVSAKFIYNISSYEREIKFI